MWKIIHLNSGHTLITEDNIDLTKPASHSTPSAVNYWKTCSTQ